MFNISVMPMTLAQIKYELEDALSLHGVVVHIWAQEIYLIDIGQVRGLYVAYR